MSNAKDAVAMMQITQTVNQLMGGFREAVTEQINKIAVSQLDQNVVTQNELLKSLISSSSGTAVNWNQYLGFSQNQIDQKAEVLSLCITDLKGMQTKFQDKMDELKEQAEKMVKE